MSFEPYEKMLPRLNDLKFFSEGTFKESSKPESMEDGTWMIEGEFSVYDQKLREYNRDIPFYKKKVGNKDGDTGYVFPILVCSKDFVKNHGDKIAVDTVKPIIFDEFNRNEVAEYIENKLRALGEVTFDELIECLDQFSWAKYDLEDEEWPESMKDRSE